MRATAPPAAGTRYDGTPWLPGRGGAGGYALLSPERAGREDDNDDDGLIVLGPLDAAGSASASVVDNDTVGSENRPPTPLPAAP